MVSKQPWRYRCPEGHSNWQPTQDGYYCESCDEYGGDSVLFDELVDMKREPLRY